MIIGLTGGSGSGKSTAAAILREKGIPVVDCDRIGHAILEPGGAAEKEVIDAFGTGIVTHGAISRKKLGEIVFRDEEKRRILNRITHKYIKDIVAEETSGLKLAAIDGALLIESGINALCDRMIVITAPEELRQKRIMARDGISLSAAKDRLSSQSDEKILTNAADAVIMNDGSKEELRAELERILQSW